jgi:hypothetical protein
MKANAHLRGFPTIGIGRLGASFIGRSDVQFQIALVRADRTLHAIEENANCQLAGFAGSGDRSSRGPSFLYPASTKCTWPDQITWLKNGRGHE